MNLYFMRLLFIFPLLLAIASAADSHRQENTIILDQAGVEALGIATSEVVESTFEETAFAIGRIEEVPERHAVLSSRIPGRVISIHAQEGDTVTEGSTLVRVESRQPGNPPPVIDLKSPISGLLVESHVRLGEPVEPEKELLDISDLSEVFAIARVPEHIAAQLSPGSKARIRVAALGKEEITAEMLRFGTAADRASGTIDAVFRVKNPGLRMRPGMTVEFAIVLSRREKVISIPREAVQGDPASRHVFIKDPGLPHAFVKTPVRLGATNGRDVEILGGLAPGSQIVVQGAYPLGFAGAGGGISLKEALDAAHGHEHNEDGSEKTSAGSTGEAAGHDHEDHEHEAHEGDEHAHEDHDHDHESHPSPWRERFFMITSGILLTLLVIQIFVKRKPTAIS